MPRQTLREYADTDVSRRSFLKLGLAATAGAALDQLGIFPKLSAQQLREVRRKLIIVFLSGGISAKEFVNPDPPSVSEQYRGPMSSIATRTPGIHFSEAWTRLAGRSEQIAVLRALDSGSNDHTPSMESAVLRGATTISEVAGGRATSGVPYVLLNPGSTWNGLQTAFRMPNAFTPLWNATTASFTRPPIAEDPSTVTDSSRLSGRLRLRDAFDTTPIHSPQADAVDRFRNTALDLLQGGGGFFNALWLSPMRRQRYGNSLAGDMLLTAKQFTEAGAGAVTVYHEPEPQAWDMHDNLRRKMLNMGGEMDVAIDALLEEIGDEIILIMGEFNRTFAMNNREGRDHNHLGNTAVLAGRTIRGGAVYGRTSRNAVMDGLVDQRTAFQNTVLAACGVDISPAAPRVRDILQTGA